MDNSADSCADTSMGAVEMSLAERFSVPRSIGEECVNEDELRLLLDKKAAPVIYVWFVPSPSMDIAQGIMKTIYVNKMVNSGCTVKILIADWFVQMNYKIGSDLNKIRTVGCYNTEVWKAAGMDLDRVELIWLSDIMNIHEANFWPLVMDIGQKNTLDGIKRCCRKTTPYGPGILEATGLLLPCLQCATMLFQKVGMQQIALVKDKSSSSHYLSTPIYHMTLQRLVWRWRSVAPDSTCKFTQEPLITFKLS